MEKTPVTEQEEHHVASRIPFVVEDEPVPQIHAKTVVLVIAVCLTYFAGLVNVVGAGAYARDLAAVLGGGDKSTWLVNSLTIMTVVLSPPISEAADFWGRKWFLVGLTAMGCVGCVIVGAAHSMSMAIAGQAVAGISYGAQPLVHAIPSEVLPRRIRPFAQACVNLAAAFGTIVGLLLGGTLTRHSPSGFRTYWYITAGLYAVSALACAVLYNPPLRELQTAITQREKLARLDWIGFLLLSGGLVLFCMSLVWSQNPYPWSDAHVLAPFILGLALIAGLISYETRFRKDGMFHHALFKGGRNFALALGCVFVEGLVFFSCNNYFAFEVGTLYEHDTLMVSVRYSICFIAFGLSTSVTAVYCSRTKSVRLPAAFAFAMFLAYSIAMATATPGSSTAVWGYPILFGTGLGICLNALVTTAQLCTPPELIATASGLMISVRSLGGSIALAIFNAIFTHTLSENLASKVPAAVLPLGLPPSSIPSFIGNMTAGKTDTLAQIPGISGPIIQAGGHAVLEAFAVAFRYVWVLAGCFSFVALIAALFLQDPKTEFNVKIDAPAESDEALFGHSAMSSKIAAANRDA